MKWLNFSLFFLATTWACHPYKKVESYIELKPFQVYEVHSKWPESSFNRSMLKADTILYKCDSLNNLKVVSKVEKASHDIEELNCVWHNDSITNYYYQVIYFIDSTKTEMVYLNIFNKSLIETTEGLTKSINFQRHCWGRRFEVYFDLARNKITKYIINW